MRVAKIFVCNIILSKGKPQVFTCFHALKHRHYNCIVFSVPPLGLSAKFGNKNCTSRQDFRIQVQEQENLEH